MTDALAALVARWRANQKLYEDEMRLYRIGLEERGEQDEGPYYGDGRAITYKTCAADLEAAARATPQENVRANLLRDAVCAIFSATGAVPHEIPRLAKDALARDNELFDAELRGDRARLAPPQLSGEAKCRECGCQTGGGDHCYQHAPYMVYPKADGSFISDRFGRQHIYVDDLAREAVPLAPPPDWQERVAHARIQGDADGFQKGWHAALTRIREGDAVEELTALVPLPHPSGGGQ